MKNTKPMTAYGVVHYLLRKIQGSASKHWCVSCAKPAAQWAYDHEDVFERIDPAERKVFSVNFEHYQPMCGRCHQQLDARHIERVRALIDDELARAG